MAALAAAVVVLAAAPVKAQVAAGYSEYFIPGSEDAISIALRSLGPTPASLNTHALISITSWSDDIIVYYDHWEDGIDFDPDNPEATYDEKFAMATTGTLLTLDNTPVGGIPIPRSSASTYYDGGDRMYVVGGAVTVTRVAYRENPGRPIQAAAWEIYPVKPQLTTYVLPFGQNLSGAPKNFVDFLRTYVIVQATADDTAFTVDLDGNGTADPLDRNFDGDTTDPGEDQPVTLQAGESFFLGSPTAGLAPVPPLGALAAVNSNAVIQGTSTLQVKFIVGDPAANYETRGLSAFPRGYWTREYYAPVGEPANATIADIFLYNPNAAQITITYETAAATGTFTINSRDTVSYRAAAGALPTGGGVYLRGSDAFWGVSTVDSTGQVNEWAYSLLPSTLLYQEHFLGWAPCGAPADGGNDSGVFLTPVQDNTRVFVDVDNDGVADQTYTLNRLQTQYIIDPTDQDLSGAHFWATGLFTMSYGQNPDTAPGQAQSGDLGYVAIPGADFISLVLTVDKSVSPQVVPTAAGAAAAVTLTAASQKYTVDSVTVVDTLPPGWAYVADSANVTKPDRTTVPGVNPTVAGSGTAADPYVLTWSSAQLGTDGVPGMAENQQVRITFTAVTTTALADGTLSRNRVRARGTRTVGGQTQTFNATDFAYVASGSLGITKSSTAPDPAYPGDQFGYTVTVTNPAGGATQTGVSLYDAIPAGLSYVPASGAVTCERPRNVRDEFNAVSYANNNGTANWSAAWAESDIHANVAGPTAGFVLVTGNALQLRYQTSNYADSFTTASYARNDGTNTWAAGWTETGDDGDPSNGSITVDAADSDRVNFGNGAAGRAITRAAAVSGGSVTVSFVLSDEGIDAGEGVIAEYDLGLGGGFVEMQRITNAALTPNVASSFTIDTAGATAITVRFRTFGTYTGNDDAGVDTVNIAVNDAVGASVRRTADLAGASSAALSFDYTAANLEAGDIIRVEASSDGTNFTTLETFDGPAGSGTRTYDLKSPTDYASANTTLRLRVASGFNQANETFAVDNVNIAYVRTDTFASANPPGFLRSSAGCQITAGDSLTLDFDVTVDNPLPTGVTTATNTAAVTTTTYPIQLTASVTDNLANPSALSASVAGRVWLDADGDGVQDLGEPGISNVEVTLKDRFGTPLATTFTDTANGNYLFTGVTAGSGYYVEATDNLRAGTTQSFPAGRADNRTAAFALAAGEDKTGVDLGYETDAGTAAFGDLAWVDADGDGARDAGEIGLGVVSVTLWRDTVLDGNLDTSCADILPEDPPGCDTAVAGYAATTAPDGSYLFTGVPATGAETYFVSAVPPAGYLATGPANHRFVNTGPGAYLTADFGFQADGASASYTFSDRVWLDSGVLGTYEGGEPGIAGATIELLDASANVIGTATTAADGTFSFGGLTGGGTDYTVRISDTAGVLADLFGTTGYALDRFRDVDNLTGSEDWTGPGDASFGFVVMRSIGDTVFNDSSGAAGDGVQQSGELGIAGVLASLYRDPNNNDRVDGGEALVGTLTTDASGRYLFSGLATGNYVVSVTAPAGYQNTPLPGGVDTDPVTAGVQQSAAVTSSGAGGSYLDADFGFRAPTQRTVSGTLWEDDDADGLIGAGETARLAGVTIQIVSGATVVVATTTDASGNYSVGGLVPASYTVRVTDPGGILNGYSATFPANGEQTADLSLADAADINFGFRLPTPTRVFLAGFRAVAAPQGVIVEWETSAEVGTVGFRVVRREGGLEVPVNERIVPAFVESRSGGRYALADPGATGTRLTYTLYEVRRTGEPSAYGPFTVAPQPAGSPPRAAIAGSLAAAAPLAIPDGKRYARQRRLPSPARTTTAAGSASAPAARAPLAAVAGQKVRVSVTADGLYRIFAADIAALLGKAPYQIERRVREGSLSLSNRGVTVAYLPRDNGASLVFHGTALDTNFADENVFWLEIGAGMVMRTVGAVAAAPSTSARHFPERLRIKERVWPDFLAATNPRADYWLWKYLVAGDEAYGYGSVAIPLAVPAPAGAGRRASLTVRLVGGNDTAAGIDHHARIRLNGTQIGEVRWGGLAAVDVVCPFDQGLLTGSDVVDIEALLDPGVPESFVYLESLGLAYRRRFVAVDNALRFTGGGNAAVTVSGFTDRSILLFDLTNPRRPRRVTGARLAGTEGNFTISFRPAAATTPYLAVAQSEIARPGAVASWRSTGLAAPGNAAEYVVITGEPLLEGAAELTARRAGQGLSTKVVTVSAIMDEFNAGVYDPAAIRSFLATALAGWSTPPRYVVLAGDGSYDYRNLLGMGAPSVPPAFVWTPYGLAASDGWYADVDGDHVPEIAVGRLPAGSNADLLRLVDKIAALETAPTGDWETSILFAADNADAAGDFAADTAALVAALPAGMTTTIDQVGATGIAAARALFKSAVDAGVAHVNWFGHAGYDVLADEKLLYLDDATRAITPELANGELLPLFTLFTCAAGDFTDPYLVNLGESLLLQHDGGAAAVFTATGSPVHARSAVLARHLFALRYGGGSGPRLGDLLLGAMDAYAADPDGGGDFTLDIYGLLGDPALLLR